MSHSPHPLTTTAIATTASSTSQSQSTPVAAAVTVSPSINSTLSLTPPPRLHETAEATTTTIPTPGPAPGTEVIDLTEAFDTEEDLMLWRLEQDLVQLHQQYFNGLWQLQQQHRHASLQHERGQEVAKIDLLRGLMGKPMPGEQEEVYDVDITQPRREPHRQQQLQQPPQQQPRQSRDRSLPPLSDLFDVARIPYTSTGPIYEREGYNQPTASSILAQRDFPGRANSGHQQPSQGNIISSPYSTQHNQPANIPQDFGANPGSPPLSTHAYGQLYEDDHQYHPECLACQQMPQQMPQQYQQAQAHHQYQESSFQPPYQELQCQLPYQERRYQQAEPSVSQHEYQGTMHRSPYPSASPPPQIIDVTVGEISSSSSSMPQEPQQNIGKSMGGMAVSTPQPWMPQQRPLRVTATSISLPTTNKPLMSRTTVQINAESAMKGNRPGSRSGCHRYHRG
ncbi:hypothetical protein BGX29_001740 [Mortierella sp. GBA35]|nr:hypothetical protein BGX29_001740 [Mortierella sp. GBA35]